MVSGYPDWTKGIAVKVNAPEITVGKVFVKPANAIKTGQKTVSVAGTAEQLVVTSTECLAVVVKALPTNTGKIYLGDSSVSSSNGFILQPSESIVMEINDLAKIYIDADNSGDGVCFLYITE